MDSEQILRLLIYHTEHGFSLLCGYPVPGRENPPILQTLVPDLIERICTHSLPHSIGELRSFLELVDYYRNLQNFAKMAFPLYNLTKDVD